MESQETKNDRLLSYWRKFAGKIATGEQGCPATFDAFKAGWEACVELYDGEVNEKFELFSLPKGVPEQREWADEIYAAYPKKVGKGAAQKAIWKALDREGSGIGWEASGPYLLEIVGKYAAAVAKWTPEDRQFIPHASTFFNQERYKDDQRTWVRQPKAAQAAWSGKPQMRLHESQIKCS